VASYFSKNPDNAKIAVLVRKINNIDHLVVDTESDALLLENNLIKKHQPRYNVMLKDDKTFPWICIKNEPFPRVFTTRKMVQDGSRYFGPYTSGRIWKSMVDLIRGMYKIRTCNLNLTEENIISGKYKVCLEYHIGNCLGPCVGNQDEENYNDQIEQIIQILNGHTQAVARVLQERVKKHSESYEYEEAGRVNEQLEMLRRFQAKSTIVNNRIRDLDVFSIVSDDKAGYVNFLKVVRGAVIQAHSMELKKRLGEEDGELLSMAIVEMRERIRSSSREIVVPVQVDYPFDNVKILIPLRGDKKTLLDLSTRNAKYFRLERQKQRVKHMPANRVSRKLETLRKDLRMENLPVHIECFDNSNIQGTNPVAACVVFRNATPSKSDYRHYNIKSVKGPDDFASMKEVIYRRYRRLKEENQDLPQLVIVDGGKGQLNAAMKSFEELGLRGSITLVGIAKRLEEIYFPGDPVPLYLDKNSESLKLIQHMRNEAHRFGISHHRGKREKALFHSELDDIKGIGPKTREALLQNFDSVEQVKGASREELEKIAGPSKAGLIIEWYKNKN
jgi:excinuclease ABC subunit C